MSKYRIELRPSRLLVVFQLLTYFILVCSVFSWQPNVIPNQISVQAVIVAATSFFIFRGIRQNFKRQSPIVIFSQQGQWLEINGLQQTSWQVTKGSRVTSLVLFLHLVSSIDLKKSKRSLIFKDQINERDYRRLCRTIFYQQQLSDKP